jgi:hypothetical protein
MDAPKANSKFKAPLAVRVDACSEHVVWETYQKDAPAPGSRNGADLGYTVGGTSAEAQVALSAVCIRDGVVQSRPIAPTVAYLDPIDINVVRAVG